MVKGVEDIPETAFTKRTVASLSLGVILIIASMHYNAIENGIGDIGIKLGIFLIAFGAIIQSIDWIIHWKKIVRKN